MKCVLASAGQRGITCDDDYFISTMNQGSQFSAIALDRVELYPFSPRE